MKKSSLQLLYSLQKKLLEFPLLVKKLERKDLDFIASLLSWITSTEEILSSYQISRVSELSGVKSKIIASKLSEERGSMKRKHQTKIAADCLYELQHVVLDICSPLESKINESRELVRQLLLIVSQTKEIKYNSQLPFDNFSNVVWQFILSHDQLKPGAIKLKTSLIFSDIQMLIAEEVNLEEF